MTGKRLRTAFLRLAGFLSCIAIAISICGCAAMVTKMNAVSPMDPSETGPYGARPLQSLRMQEHRTTPWRRSISPPNRCRAALKNCG